MKDLADYELGLCLDMEVKCMIQVKFGSDFGCFIFKLGLRGVGSWRSRVKVAVMVRVWLNTLVTSQ